MKTQNNLQGLHTSVKYSIHVTLGWQGMPTPQLLLWQVIILS